MIHDPLNTSVTPLQSKTPSRSNLMARCLFRRSSALAALAIALLCASCHADAQSNTQPPPVVATSTTTVGTALNQPQSVAVDSSGNVFVANAGAGDVVEYPANGSASVTIITNLSYNKGVTVDSSGNVYSTSYGGSIYKWAAGAAANSGSSFTSGSTCPDFAAMGYYIGFDDLTADGQGNIYALGGNSYILEFNAQGQCTERLTPAELSSAPGAVAADAAGDLYYTINNTIYYLPAGSTTSTPLSIASGTFSSINGMTIDANGDLIITDASSLDEIPMVNGSLQTSKISYLVSAGAAQNAAVTQSGVLYYGNFNANSVVRSAIGSLALGSSAVGTPGTAGVITYTFNAAVTPTQFSFINGAGASTQFVTAAAAAGATNTCAAGTAYPASTSSAISSCTLNVALDAALPGKVTGAVLFGTASGNLATTYLSGDGLGAGLAVDPGTQTSLGNFTTPSAVQVDGSGNIFVADSGANTVTEFPAGSTAGISIGSGLNAPQGLAVDPAGNLFIANTGSNQIVEVPLVGGVLNSSGQTVVASGLNAPLGLAVDLSGNILVANSGAGNVLLLPNQGGVVGSLPPYAIGSGFKKPTAIAVDPSGNIFIGDATAANIVEITPTGQQSSILANYSQLAGLAVDANDDIYLTQTGVPAVTRIAFIAGAYATNSTSSLGSGLVGPQGIAIDTAGDLYVADASGGAAYAIQRTLGSLSFGKVNLNTNSASQTLTLSNNGNQALAFQTPFFTAVSGNTADFSVAAAANNGCSTALATGVSCAVSAIFTPSASGARSATFDFQSNAVNAATIGAQLSGTGANSAPTTLTLSVSPSGSISFGQTVVVTATVAPVSTSTSSPTGTVQFSVDGINYGPPVTLGTNGTATDSITGLTGGQHTIDATYSGDNTFASSSATTPTTLTIATATTNTSLTATISATTAVPTGSSVTFTATVLPVGSAPPPYPSGSVTFYQAGNSTALGTAPLTNGVASFTTTALPNGQYNVVATYSGDTDYSTSTSVGYTVYISPPTFLFSTPSTSVTLPANGSTSLSFTLTPIAGYTGSVIPSCTGLPSNTVCSFSPGGVDFTVNPTAQTVVLTISSGVPPSGFAGFWWLPGLFSLAALLLCLRRRKSLRVLTVAALALCTLFTTAALSGCSGSSATSTPAGSSTVTVQLAGSAAASGGATIQQSFTFNLQVQ